MSIELLQFEIDSQRYALRLDDVVEVVRAVAIGRLPDAPGIVEGVIDLRGRIVPVFDVRARFRHPARELCPSEHFVIVRASGRVVAMRTDRALDIVCVDAEDVEELAASVPGARYISGVAKTNDGVVLIHDLRQFLSAAESETLDRALGDAHAATA